MISEHAAALSPAELLETCDRLLGEVGRRSHLFSWLRPDGPSAGGIPGEERWLVVDCYYPRHRLAVIIRDQPHEHDGVYGELIPKHGLNLLAISPQELGRRPRCRRSDAALAPGTDRAAASDVHRAGGSGRAQGAAPPDRAGRRVARPAPALGSPQPGGRSLAGCGCCARISVCGGGRRGATCPAAAPSSHRASDASAIGPRRSARAPRARKSRQSACS